MPNHLYFLFWKLTIDFWDLAITIHHSRWFVSLSKLKKDMPMIMHYILERNHAFRKGTMSPNHLKDHSKLKKNMPSNVHFLLGRKFVNQLHTTSWFVGSVHKCIYIYISTQTS
jgi:hypothetical protein